MVGEQEMAESDKGEKMTQHEALALCEELRKLAGDWPGPRPEALRRAEQIDFAFAQESRVTAYLREKVGEVLSDFGYWCTEHRWRQFGNDPSHLRGQLLNSLAKLESTINQEYSSKQGEVDKA